MNIKVVAIDFSETLFLSLHSFASQLLMIGADVTLLAG